MSQTLNATLGTDNILKRSYEYLKYTNTSELREQDVFRDKRDYELVFFYPPQRTLKPVNAEDIFETSKDIVSSRKDVGMYVHIPFCTGQCSYCHYIRFTNSIPKVVEKYLRNLEREFKLLSKAPYICNSRIINLHIGGGTPTYLDEEQITRIMNFIKETFQIADSAEVTWESSPDTIIGKHTTKLSTLIENGVNRLNIGIQTFEDELLKTCNRRHSAAEAEDAIRFARESGFTNVNIDVIYGLPGQSMENWVHTLDKIEELLPESVTLYHLRMHPDSKFAILQVDAELPPEETCLLMQIYGYERLKEMGYTQVQPCQFVLSLKDEHHYVLDKWGKGKEFVGTGVSAYGYINDYIYVNHRRMKSYFESIQSETLPICLGKKLSTEQLMVKSFILNLKVLLSGAKQKEFEQKFGITIREVFGETLSRLEELGLIRITPVFVMLTWKGILFADEVCTKFYTVEENNKLKRITTKYGCYLRS